MSPGESGNGALLASWDFPTEIKFDTSRLRALFPSLTGTNLFGVIFFTAFVGGLRDLVRECEDTVEAIGFGVSDKLLGSTFVSSKEI